MAYEEMSANARATEFLRKAIVAIPLGIVLLVVANVASRELAELGFILGAAVALYGGYALLRGLWYKVG